MTDEPHWLTWAELVLNSKTTDSVSKNTVFMNLLLCIVTAIPSSFRLRTSVLDFLLYPLQLIRPSPVDISLMQPSVFRLSLLSPSPEFRGFFGLCHILHGFSLYSKARS